jgi:hypothetical protein
VVSALISAAGTGPNLRNFFSDLEENVR